MTYIVCHLSSTLMVQCTVLSRPVTMTTVYYTQQMFDTRGRGTNLLGSNEDRHCLYALIDTANDVTDPRDRNVAFLRIAGCHCGACLLLWAQLVTVCPACHCVPSLLLWAQLVTMGPACHCGA